MERILHNLKQDTPEWLAFRAEHDGASELSAAIGISPHTKRNELLKIKKTGVSKEFSDFVQKNILDKGHAVEAKARVLVEVILGEDLSPVTMSYGRLSASCDGLTFDGTIAWENKQYNAEHFRQVQAGQVPEIHVPQCQQILYVTGAERLFFTISDGTYAATVGVWVYPDQGNFDYIDSVWAQFNKDLDAFIVEEAKAESQVEVVRDLPLATIQAKGELLSSNLEDITPHFDKFLKEAKKDLNTDDDFAIAEAESKVGRDTAKRCRLTAKAVIDQIATVSEAVRILEDYAAKFDALALLQEKAVRQQKEALKASAKLEREKKYNAHISVLAEQLHPIPLNISAAEKPDFIAAMANQRKLSSINNNLDTELSRAIIAADAVTAEIKRKKDLFDALADKHAFLFNDLDSIVYKPEDDFILIVKTRISDFTHEQLKKKQEEEQRINALNTTVDALSQSSKGDGGAAPLNPALVAVLQEAVVDNQDEISTFLKSRNFGKEETKIRSILVEFIKHQVAFNLKKAA